MIFTYLWVRLAKRKSTVGKHVQVNDSDSHEGQVSLAAALLVGLMVEATFLSLGLALLNECLSTWNPIQVVVSPTTDYMRL